MEWGGSASWLEDIAEEQGFTPPALANRAIVFDHLESVWEAFWSLIGDRQYGASGGASRISFTAINSYAERHRIDDLDEFERFETLIRRLDDTYLEWFAEKAEKED